MLGLHCIQFASLACSRNQFEHLCQLDVSIGQCFDGQANFLEFNGTRAHQIDETRRNFLEPIKLPVARRVVSRWPATQLRCGRGSLEKSNFQ